MGRAGQGDGEEVSCGLWSCGAGGQEVLNKEIGVIVLAWKC